MKILNLIEPTLFDQTGHSYGYVRSLLVANQCLQFNMQIWLDKRGKNLLHGLNCTRKAYFYRPLRQIQKLFLYAKLIRKREIIFISTTELWDIKILRFYSKYFKVEAKIILHFHQFKQTPKKLKYLQQNAASCSNMEILVPTTKLATIFQKFNFKCTVVPCPTFSIARTLDNTTAKFHKVLYAGAARHDKGFGRVVNLLHHFRVQQNFIPFEIQVSTPNSKRYDNETELALKTIQNIDNRNLVLHKDTLDQEQYLSLFNNAICLLLYDQKSYQDKFSGIALDAFYAGCPIVTIEDTWMGDIAQKYQAGIALHGYSLESIQTAIETIIKNYDFYHTNAKKAALELSKLHDPINTLLCISQKCS